MLFTIIAVIHVVLCLALMGLVLLQQGKGADAGAVLGGGGDSLMAVGGAGVAITKITTALAVSFMITSIVLVKLYDQSIKAGPAVVEDGTLLKGSVMEGQELVPPPTDNKAATDPDIKPNTDTKSVTVEPADQPVAAANPENASKAEESRTE